MTSSLSDIFNQYEALTKQLADIAGKSAAQFEKVANGTHTNPITGETITAADFVEHAPDNIKAAYVEFAPIQEKRAALAKELEERTGATLRRQYVHGGSTSETKIYHEPEMIGSEGKLVLVKDTFDAQGKLGEPEIYSQKTIHTAPDTHASAPDLHTVATTVAQEATHAAPVVEQQAGQAVQTAEGWFAKLKNAKTSTKFAIGAATVALGALIAYAVWPKSQPLENETPAR